MFEKAVIDSDFMMRFKGYVRNGALTIFIGGLLIGTYYLLIKNTLAMTMDLPYVLNVT